MSRELQPPVLSVSPIKIELPTVIKNEPPESEIVEIGIDDILDSSEEEIIPDVKGIDIVYHPACEGFIKNEILEIKHCESLETQVLEKTENSPFIKTENITERNKTEDTSDEHVTKGTGQAAVQVQASNEYSNALSNLETEEQSVFNFSKDLNGERSRKSESPKKTDFVECYKTDDATLWEKEKEEIQVIKAPLIPVEAHEYISLAKDRHVCNNCQHAFNRLDNLKRHIQRRHREFTTMVIKAPLIAVGAHEYISLAKDRHVCNNCQLAFNRLDNLKRHIQRRHREFTAMYQCPYCPFKSKYSVQRHIIQKHKDNKDIQWFQCNLCEMKFKLKAYLTQHMKVHLKQMQDGLDLGEKRYDCDKCDYKTYRNDSLKNHKLTHLKPEEIEYFYCYHCSYKSKEKRNLRGHIFRHHFKNVEQGKRHHCDQCNYKSYTSTLLKSHKLSHLKPEEIQYFYCYHCSYKAKWKATLKKHIFLHFKKEQVKFDCYICNFITPKRESIIKHIKKHSKVQNKSEINEKS